MVKSEDKTVKEHAPKANDLLIEMILTMAGTTWRMFVPILGFLFLGIYIDKSLTLFPWCTLLGFVVGVAIAAVLIRNQLKKGAA